VFAFAALYVRGVRGIPLFVGTLAGCFLLWTFVMAYLKYFFPPKIGPRLRKASDLKLR
jgi:hypothetical protein